MTALRPLWLAMAGFVCLALISVDPASSGEAKKLPFKGGIGKGGIGGGDIFKKLDTNGDGKLSKEEFSKFGNGQGAQLFEKIDTDKDGYISQAEAAKLRELILSKLKK